MTNIKEIWLKNNIKNLDIKLLLGCEKKYMHISN